MNHGGIIICRNFEKYEQKTAFEMIDQWFCEQFFSFIPMVENVRTASSDPARSRPIF